MSHEVRTGILIGGESRRMGAPKQLLPWRGQTLLESIVDVLSEVSPPVLLGKGPVPEALAGSTRLDDAEGFAGPLGGVVAALRHDATAWIVCGCDMPCITREALEWLIGRRRKGITAVLPDALDRVQPLLALYEAAILPSIPEGNDGPHELASLETVITPAPPAHLRDAWRNVNRPEDLATLRGAG